MTVAPSVGLSAADQATIHVEVKTIAAFIALMATAWVVLAILFIYHFYNSPIGVYLVWRDLRPVNVGKNGTTEYIELEYWPRPPPSSITTGDP